MPATVPQRRDRVTGACRTVGGMACPTLALLPRSAAREFRGDRRRAAAGTGQPQPAASRVQPVGQPPQSVSLVQGRTAHSVVRHPDPQRPLAVAQPDLAPAAGSTRDTASVAMARLAWMWRVPRAVNVPSLDLPAG